MASLHPARVYLDYNATAPIRPEARAAALAAMDHLGNPSSIHAEGRGARAIVEEARRAVAEFVGASPRGVVFTSGGTEAANLALSPAIAPDRKIARIVVGAGEHPCVLQGHRFPAAAVSIAPLAADGRLDLAALTELVEAAEGPVMLALQGANNETGVLQPIAEAAAIVHAGGGLVVCDAVQMAGRVELSPATLGADFVFLSAHKFGGPKGAGALVATRGEAAVGAPLLRGGGQERGARAGTENVAAIAGFGAAARLAGAERVAESARLAALRDALTAAVLATAPDAAIFGAAAPRLSNTLCF
ncbi:MAG: aminotransferase class V-fold PLP-dependent enzyme, partial [Hyphomicrobiales bacterium]|nr:aminotransferase class V-fold PLP-dependent enzyme [Hyphomicrobiales bacterium]